MRVENENAMRPRKDLCQQVETYPGNVVFSKGYETWNYERLATQKRLKLLIVLLAPIVAVGMASTALAAHYKDVVAEGYRWVSLDGPFACPLKEDLRTITREPSDTSELHIVEQVRALLAAIARIFKPSRLNNSITKVINVQLSIRYGLLS
jgi:hypothetical protein